MPTKFHRNPIATAISPLCLAVLALLAGCNSPEAQFVVNRLYVAKQAGSDGLPEHQLEDISVALTAMFGTPDAPFPADSEDAAKLELSGVIDPTDLTLAAGPVRTDEDGVAHGLYRQHCVHCHGVTGDGRGPTAEFLNPYPRDFRAGKFKFKSTPIGEKPTDDDLRKTLVNGVPGTAMPSFKLLASDEIEALVNYVKYLSIRGEVERKLIEEAALGLDPEDNLDTSRGFLVEIILADVVEKWTRADDAVMPVPPRPSWQGEQRLASIRQGNELFHGKLANCFTCHGVTGLGDGQTTDYDDWTKEFADWNKITDPAEKAEKIEEYRELGGLGPRTIQPRNLRLGEYRGGRRPVDIYWRIRNGIEGTPMPAATLQSAPGATGLTEEDIWHIVDYVQSLPYESISQPPEAVVENLRENP